MELIKQLNWRYAAKRMNGEKVQKEKIDRVLEAIRLSPSSMGFQPYTVYVIENEEVRRKIYETSCKQPQILEGSHLIVFAAWTHPNQEDVEKYIQLIADERQIPTSSLADFQKSISGVVTSRTQEQLLVWTAKQAYIALGTAIAAAALEEIDATPMEGFQSDSLDEVLGLKEKNQKSVVLLTLGYRDEASDPLVKAKKVRRPKEELFVNI
ncbi:nitroreductase family protein [Leptospira idonii]|uniref:NAD(P)H-dependent oxidoreductase n=1 Tax=Leptospira idonii TaxID=1193500 RepID=A0A4R9LX45_9LEPT|nr:nitroreductase family protein [Leptospira idonii]TGN18232.1 NAD(P)H-dependent oxidoreductase [Leptospira idonii]